MLGQHDEDEGPDAAEAYVSGGGDDVDDDPEVDERPLRPALEQGPVLQLAPVAYALLGSSSSESSGSSTEEPSLASQGTSGCHSEAGCGDPGSDPAPGFSGGLVYTAGQDVLYCTYGDDTLSVPLGGWAVEEVETVVHGLHTGNWEPFQQMMATDESGDAVEPSSSGKRGLRSVSRETVSRALESSWRPRRQVVLLWLLLLWLAWGSFQLVGGERFQDQELCQPTLLEDASSTALLVRRKAQDVDLPEEEMYGCDGSVMWECFRMLLIIVTWELFRRVVVCRLAWSARFKEAGSQTSPLGVVPMPLDGSMRCRGKILYCFWRAGLQVDPEEYPSGIQSEFYSLVGAYLQRVEQGLVSESDSD